MSDKATIVVKRYGGQRLYEPSRARYVTAEQIRAWHGDGMPVAVRDAKSGEDVTEIILMPPSNLQ